MRGGSARRRLSFRGSSKASIDDPPDLGAARAAIGSGIQRLADSFDRAAAATDGSNDLVDPDIETGADGCSRIGLIRTRSAGHERKAKSQIGMRGAELLHRPAAGNGDGFWREIKRQQQLGAIEEGKPAMAGRPVGIADWFDIRRDIEDASAPRDPIIRLGLRRQFEPPPAPCLGQRPIGAIKPFRPCGTDCKSIGGG